MDIRIFYLDLNSRFTLIGAFFCMTRKGFSPYVVKRAIGVQ